MSTALCCLMMVLPQANTAEVDDLIRQLDSDKFAQRRAASKRLTEMGAEAFEPLVQSAQSSSAEVQRRSMDILENHFRNGEAATREAAKNALEKLAQSDSHAGRFAEEVLQPSPQPNAFQNRVVGPVFMPAAQQQAIKLQMQVRPGRIAGGRQKAQRKIQFSDGKKTVKISIDGEQIKMEITEKVDGKQVTKKYEAKSEAELKKKHPAAYQEYKRHAQNMPNGAKPAVQIQRAVRPAPAKAAAGRIIDALKKSEAKLQDELKRAEQKLEGEEKARAIQSLNKRLDRLQELRKRYGARNG